VRLQAASRRGSSRIAWSIAAALGLASVPGSAAAQQPTPEQLFEEGRRAMARGDYATACPSLRTSLEQSGSKGALYNLALCEDEGKAGRLATSLALWQRVRAEFADQPEIVREAETRIAELERKVAKLQFRLGAEAPADTSVELDGARAALDVDVPVDAGRHRVVVVAPHHEPRSSEVTIGDGEKQVIAVLPGSSTAPVPGGGTTVPPDESAGGSGWTTAGFIAGGVGIAGIALYAISLPILFGVQDDIETRCPVVEDEPICRTEEDEAFALDARNRGETWQVVNVVGLVTGIVGVGAGITFLAIGAGDDSPQISFTGDRVQLDARF
jgi:hypothetical protein